MTKYLEVDVSHTEVDDNCCERQKYGIHLERGLEAPPSFRFHPIGSLLQVGCNTLEVSWTRWAGGWAGKPNRSRCPTHY